VKKPEAPPFDQRTRDLLYDILTTLQTQLLHSDTVIPARATHRLRCSTCGKSVSSEFYPVPTDTPDRGLIVRAFVQCPECLEKGTTPVT
jgi:hypothetical protein